MPEDFSQLDHRAFELLCSALIAAEGNRVTGSSTWGQHDYGIDLSFESTDGRLSIVQMKMLRSKQLPLSKLRSALLDLQRARNFTKADQAILMISIPIPAEVREQLPIEPNTEIWDETHLQSLLNKHPEVLRAYLGIINSQQAFEAFFANSKTTQADSSPGTTLLDELAAVPPEVGWREYEEVCVKILNYVFIPPLRVPRVQSRTHDGLDRRDAIYPIGFGDPFWDSIKHQHAARMIVVEFKNYRGPIGQREVESLQQYLMPDAMRSVGILCSRKQPSDSALKARRRAWMESKRLILFLSDLDLAELVRTRIDEANTSRILEAQLDDFFITLAP